jgi:hypothetical protein
MMPAFAVQIVSQNPRARKKVVRIPVRRPIALGKSLRVRYVSAFLARYAGLGANGPWVADGFVGWWVCDSFPAQAQLGLVWACELEPFELGKPLTIDVSMISPSGSSLLIQRLEGVPSRPSTAPADLPYFWEFGAFNFDTEFDVAGLYEFELRSGSGVTCAIPLYVQGPA